MIQTLKLTLFGAPQISLGNKIITEQISGKPLALFIYLAVTGRAHTRDALAHLLWSELPQPQARNNLRYLLSDLRSILGDYLFITTQTISFNRNQPYWLDVEILRTTLTSRHQSSSAEEMQAALDLQQGEFLAGFRVRNAPVFMEWVAEQRQELYDLTAQALVPVTPFPKHNLPNLLTPFFGREQEIAEIVAHLGRDGYRLLTITGEGGVGKTRLALAVAQTIWDLGAPGPTPHLDTALGDETLPTKNPKSKIQNPKFPDGVWFITLADLRATADLPDQLAIVIGKALHLPFRGQGAPTEQIIYYLANKQMLLILDNFEHLHSGVNFLLDLLHKTTGTKLLVTTRHRLNIHAEYPWRITGLPLPSMKQSKTLSSTKLLQYAGIALFVERARRASPCFQINTTNQAEILQICHFVQGLPLGIELAAALTKEYSCAELLTALQNDYAILDSVLPDLDDRHRNIKLVFDYSWRFLEAKQARILAQCTVFHGGFDQEAALAVTEATPAILTALVDQSLLCWATATTGRGRYELHALVRQYALERLPHTSSQQQEAQARHATYFMAKLQQAEALLIQDGVAQEQIRYDFENIQAAWIWSAEQGRLDLLAQGSEMLTRFYRLTGLHRAGLHAFQAAVATVRLADPTSRHTQLLLADLLIRTSEFYRFVEELDKAEKIAQEALTLGRQMDEVALQGRAYQELARVAQRRNQYGAMRTLAEQACLWTRQSGLARLQAMSLNDLGVSEVLCGDLAHAIDCYHAGLRYLQQAPDCELEATLIANLGGGYKRCREYIAAIDYLTLAVKLAQSINNPYSVAMSQVLLGNLWIELGAFECAQTVLAQALHIFSEIHDPYWEAWGRTSQAHLYQLRGDATAAAEASMRVLSQVQGKLPLMEHRALTYLGDARCTLGEREAGERLYKQALAIEQQVDLHFRLAEPVIRLAELLLQRNESIAAQTLLEKPLAELMEQGLAVVAEPFALYLTSYRVFKANADPRAGAILQQAYSLLQDLAAKIEDVSLRQSFLENVAPRRALMALAQADLNRF